MSQPVIFFRDGKWYVHKPDKHFPEMTTDQIEPKVDMIVYERACFGPWKKDLLQRGLDAVSTHRTPTIHTIRRLVNREASIPVFASDEEK